jgi:hypothetical protein
VKHDAAALENNGTCTWHIVTSPPMHSQHPIGRVVHYYHASYCFASLTMERTSQNLQSKEHGRRDAKQRASPATSLRQWNTLKCNNDAAALENNGTWLISAALGGVVHCYHIVMPPAVYWHAFHCFAGPTAASSIYNNGARIAKAAKQRAWPAMSRDNGIL